ncbi:hypothetical protein [Acidisphaera rubrifaciens]|uniref:Uncharacterized protein n=1 Tax=Acidisphaera rubrifaciens HS-AP3 TaxID=1231350 RepID=A0A0D6P4I6_9PROT|nr:hypothetical protein [Acidisphaera rubrifaciens]GAN76592.1 hypothetical protein Asru_0123_03 [Acidisphaera rubrifaciens HS-AP3]
MPQFLRTLAAAAPPAASPAALAVMLAAALLLSPATHAAAPSNTPAPSATAPPEGSAPDGYTLEVHDVSSPVGTPSALHVTLRPRPGYRILEGYNNRIIMLSSYNGGVAFAHKMVRGTVQDGTLVFDVGVTPTAPGSHPINGVVRVGYIRDPEDMSMVSMKLIATVTGTE